MDALTLAIEQHPFAMDFLIENLQYKELATGLPQENPSGDVRPLFLPVEFIPEENVVRHNVRTDVIGCRIFKKIVSVGKQLSEKNYI